jgi:hypothetical protein
MHPLPTLIVAQQRIADLHRAADHDRLVHTATTASRSDAPTAGRPVAAAPVSFLRWLGRRLPHPRIPGRLEPREDQAGDCK